MKQCWVLNRFFLLRRRRIKAVRAASLQWNIYIVIKESGCENVWWEEGGEKKKLRGVEEGQERVRAELLLENQLMNKDRVMKKELNSDMWSIQLCVDLSVEQNERV